MHWLERYDVALRQLHWSLVEDMRLDMGGTDAIVLFMAPMPTTGVPSIARAVPKAARQPGRFYMQTQHTAFQFRQPPISTFAFPSAQKKKSDFPSTPPPASKFISWEAPQRIHCPLAAISWIVGWRLRTRRVCSGHMRPHTSMCHPRQWVANASSGHQAA